MSLPHGKRFGPYEILELIGVGGMGEVYRARDTRLDRAVAVKVLAARVSAWPKARARFEREARAISSLSHPHICAVYDVGHEDGIDYIVMEYLQGESLSRRLSRRGLRLDDALRHAVEIAGALASAHRAGIVHRDLKPANVMLTPSGAKLLDFGLAKLHPEERDLSSGTTAEPMTAEGLLVGTLPYMSPEQVEGKAADARSDIFSFGAMLHEMVTQQRAFEGSQAHLIAAILSTEPPPPSRLQPRCPPELDHLVARCLAKSPEERWQSAQDLLLELKWVATRAPSIETPRKRSLRVLGWAAGALLAVVLVAAVLLRRSGEDALPNASPRQVTTAPGWESAPALSPDGGLIAYSSDESGNADIWLVDARGGNAIRLTDDPASDTDPAWFPDGSALAFTSDRGGGPAIWKVLRFGGAPSLLVPDAVDPAISADGTQIAFARPGATHDRIWIAPLARSDPSEGADRRHRRHLGPQRSRVLTGRPHPLLPRPAGPLAGIGGGTRSAAADQRRRTRHRARLVARWPLRLFFVEAGRLLGALAGAAGGGPPRRVTPGTGGERHPSISRDGRRLAFATLSANPDLFLLDLSTRKEALLRGLRPMSPAWAPDGRSLVFSSTRIGGRVRPLDPTGARPRDRRRAQEAYRSPGIGRAARRLARRPMGGVLPRRVRTARHLDRSRERR